MYISTPTNKLENLKLDCTGQLIRDIWKASNWETLEAVYPDLADFERRYQRYYRQPRFKHVKRELIAHLAGYIGVEYLGRCKRSGVDVYYCNAGDTYTPTIVFKGNRLFISCWGHFVENNLVKTDMGY